MADGGRWANSVPGMPDAGSVDGVSLSGSTRAGHDRDTKLTQALMRCDWAQIAALYEELARLTGSPVVELNRAIAVAETEGPEAGLRIVDQLGLDDFRYLHSTRAELLRRLGRTDEARIAYRRARELTEVGAERRFLERRLMELASTSGSG